MRRRCGSSSCAGGRSLARHRSRPHTHAREHRVGPLRRVHRPDGCVQRGTLGGVQAVGQEDHTGKVVAGSTGAPGAEMRRQVAGNHLHRVEPAARPMHVSLVIDLVEPLQQGSRWRRRLPSAQIRPCRDRWTSVCRRIQGTVDQKRCVAPVLAYSCVDDDFCAPVFMQRSLSRRKWRKSSLRSAAELTFRRSLKAFERNFPAVGELSAGPRCRPWAEPQAAQALGAAVR